VIRVDHAEREEFISAQIERVAEAEWPKLGRGLSLGTSAGIFAGLFIGLGEAAAIVHTGNGRAEGDVWAYGSVSYGVVLGLLGAATGLGLALSGRLMQRRAMAEPDALGHMAGSAAAFFTLVIGAFRVQRDVFHEELAWKSAQGALVLLAAMAAAALVYGLFFFVLRTLARGGAASILRPLFALSVLALTAGITSAWAQRNEAAPQGQGGGTAAAGAGHVLYIVVDTVRADHLPLYGYSAGRTPHLDAFARDAVRFEQAYANASWTRPSFASLLTGRYASSHGVMSKSAGLPDEALTLAEAFRAGGYATMGVVTNYNVAPFFNFQQGFDAYHYLAPNFLFGASDSAAKLSLLQIVRRVDEGLRAALKRNEPGSAYQDASVVNAELLKLIDGQPKGRPWLMFAGYMDPHDPYYEHPYNGVGYSRAAHIKPRADEAARLRALYDGEITFWDEHFGKLISALKARGLYTDLTIVVTADHGEEFMDHGGFWHGTTLYDEQLHVPLLIKLPRGERAGQSVAHWVESVDIMPTLLERAQLAVPKEVQGLNLFRGKDQTFAEESHDGNVLRSLRTRGAGTAMKLIVANPENPRGLKARELYAVESDPGERTNLAEAQAEALTRTGAELESVSQQAKTSALKAREVDLSMDKTAEERLKALGYAGEQ
jgi:arylsulfatase A-like enzyme